MTPSVWIALGTVVMAVVVHFIASSFMAGRLFQRVSTLEKRDDTLARLDSTVTRMDANMGHLTQSVDELKGRLEWATNVAPPRRRGAVE